MKQLIRSMIASLGWLIIGLISISELHPQLAAQTFENSPIGFASVNANGQNGTTGGAGGPTVTATTASELQSFAGQSGPLIIQVSGTITLSSDISVASNKTIIGLGSNAAVTSHGLIMSGVQNIIVRNIAFSNAAINSITIQTLAHHVWVDHCDFTNATDTLMDIKRQANYVTVSWNHFTNTLETILEGHSDTFTQDIGFLKVTYHHNWFDGTVERHPRVRFSDPTHVFNNYYLNLGMYGVASTMNAGVLVEGNYFNNVPQPTLTDISGSAAPGNLVERNNTYVSSGTPQTRGTVTEPSTFYSYSLDPTANVPTIVTNGAGTGKINTNPSPDFSISATRGSQTVTAGSGTSYTATVTPVNGFNGTVNFSVSGLPAGASGSFSPASVTGSGSSTLSVSTSSTTPAGTYTLTITGTSSTGNLSHSATVTLVVNPAPTPNFTISATASSQTVTAGAATSYTASVTAVNGFTGTVTFSVSGLPSGASGSFSPTSVAGSGSSTLSVSTSSTTPPGTYTLTITGTSGSLVHSATVTLVVNAAPDFTISASPSSQTITAGSGTSYTASVTALHGFGGTVTFGVSGLPSGASGSFSPASVTGSGSSTLSVSTGSTTPAGTFTLTITGTSGSLTHSTTVTLVVNSPSSNQFTFHVYTVNPNPSHVGTSTKVGMLYTDTGSGGTAQTFTLAFQVVGPSGAVVATHSASVSMKTGDTHQSTLTFTPSATGTYTVQGTVTNSSGAVVAQNNNVATFTVN